MLALGLSLPQRSNSVLAGAGRGAWSWGSLSPSAEGLSSSLFLLAGGGTGSTKKLAVDILGSPPTLDFKLLHQIGTVGASEDWRDPFCPSFQGCTENSQVPFGIGKRCPKSCRSLEMGTQGGWQRGSDVPLGKSAELGILTPPHSKHPITAS